MAKLKEGDLCRFKGDNYLHLKVYKILPKGYQGRRCVLVQCLASGGCYPPNFDFAIIKTFRMVDLVKADFKVWTRVKEGV